MERFRLVGRRRRRAVVVVVVVVVVESLRDREGVCLSGEMVGLGVDVGFGVECESERGGRVSSVSERKTPESRSRESVSGFGCWLWISWEGLAVDMLV